MRQQAGRGVWVKTGSSLAHECSSVVTQLVCLEHWRHWRRSSKGEFVMLYSCHPPAALVWKPTPALLNTCCALFPPYLRSLHPDKHVLTSSSTAQTSLTGRSASSRSRGGSGMWGSKLLRRRHGDSSELLMVVAGGSQVTLPGASPAGTGVLACGCDWAVAAGSWSARCPTPGCERVPHVTAAPHSG